MSALVRSIADLTEVDPSEDSAEISVINRGEPGEIDRPSWLIRTDPPPPGLRLVGVSTNLGVTWQRPGEPVLDDVSLAGTAMAETQVVQTDEWLPLVKSGEVPPGAVGAGERPPCGVLHLRPDPLQPGVVQMAFPPVGIQAPGVAGRGGGGRRRSLSGGDAHPGASSGDGGSSGCRDPGESR